MVDGVAANGHQRVGRQLGDFSPGSYIVLGIALASPHRSAPQDREQCDRDPVWTHLEYDGRFLTRRSAGADQTATELGRRAQCVLKACASTTISQPGLRGRLAADFEALLRERVNRTAHRKWPQKQATLAAR